MAKIKKRVNLHTAKKEIREWQTIEAGATFEIGRILTEVKNSEIPRGEWTAWLEEVGYNPRTAQRYMQVYERFHSVEGASDLPISKLTELLSLPVDVDASQFIEEAKVKSVRELRDKVRELNESQKQPKSEAKLKQSRKVDNAEEAFNNLIPEYLEKINEGEEFSVQNLIKIGRESHKIQRKTLHFDLRRIPDVRASIILAKVTPDEKLTYINELVCELISLTILDLGFVINWGEIEFENYEQAEAFLKENINQAKQEREERFKDYRGGFKDFFNSGKSAFSSANRIPATEILGVTDSTPRPEVKKRYRKLMHLLHPDKGGDAHLFDIVKKAYDSIVKDEAS